MRGNNVLGIIFSNAHDEVISEMTGVRTMGSIPFAGRYRLIDFPLSSMVNASISKVGVICKANYQSLMDHLGTGKPWDLSRKTNGLFLLPPFNLGSSGVYSSKIEALSGIKGFIDQSNEKYVVLADCNVVANVDYQALFDMHEKSGADITVVTAHGATPDLKNILTFDIAEDGRVNSAKLGVAGEESDFSLNIYVMEKYLLLRLIADGMAKPNYDWSIDAIIGNTDKLRIFAYKHETYCSVVDSISSFFKDNMDLLSYTNRKELFVNERPVFTKTRDSMPTRYGLQSNAKKCFVADGCVIEGEAENCIIFRNVTISAGAKVKNCIIMQDTFIGEDARVEYSILDKEVVIKPRKTLCGADSYPIYVGKKTTI